jgi:uncharacterized protein YggE
LTHFNFSKKFVAREIPTAVVARTTIPFYSPNAQKSTVTIRMSACYNRYNNLIIYKRIFMATENQSVHTCTASGGGACTGICWKKKLIVGALLLAISGSLFLFALFMSTMKEYRYIGRNQVGEFTTINVTGEGESFRAPDVAEVSYSITQEGKDAATARKQVDDKMKAIHAFLKESGVEDKDIKTTGYNLNPKYEWKQTSAYVPCVSGYGCPPVEGKQVLVGYEVTQSVDVRIRKIDNAGLVLGGLSDKGAAYVSGLTFKVDDEDGVKEEARKEAIDKAKAKAQKLAKELGVKLVRITSFNEGGSYPMYNYARGGMEKATMAMDEGMQLQSANIPVGENKFTSSVTITYEVR